MRRLELMDLDFVSGSGPYKTPVPTKPEGDNSIFDKILEGISSFFGLSSGSCTTNSAVNGGITTVTTTCPNGAYMTEVISGSVITITTYTPGASLSAVIPELAVSGKWSGSGSTGVVTIINGKVTSVASH
ncbi:hypothetical protein KSF73_08195 [Burkholderiaceae bacterium DAT-1]|nr:hypothetical protein [Burkholderiaceae bacterium DAT-1]